MCFYVDKNHTDLKTAKKNITCYKFMYLKNKKFESPFQCFTYKPGELVIVKTGWRATNKRAHSEINKGLHSFSTKKEAVRSADTGQVVVECTIPKGSKYFYNERDSEYVSNQLIIVKRIPKR